MASGTFYKFPLLPIEIRIKIWTTALNTPSVIQACFDCDTSLKDLTIINSTNWDAVITQVNRNVPPMLHANRESRAQALKIYPDIPGPADIYVNNEIDTLFFGADTTIFPLEVLYETLAGPGGLDIGRLKHLAVNINWWRTFEATYWWRDYLFNSLDTLTVFVEDPDEGESRFEEIGRGDDALLWDYDHEVGFGIKHECEKERGCLKAAMEKLLEDDENSDYADELAVPDVKALKLRGKIMNFATKEDALRYGWWYSGKYNMWSDRFS